MDDLQVCLSTTLPQAIAGLNESHKNIEQIATYCKKAYETESDQTAVFAKTQAYVKDALSNVAYHIHTVGLHITNFLQLQANEIDKLELQISTLTDRVKSAHDTVGTSGFRTMEAIKGSGRIQKNRKLEDHELPPNAKPLPKFARQQINLKALDNVGIDLSGNKGNDNFGTTLQTSVSIQAPPPVLSSPPSLAPPPSFGNLAFQPPPPMPVLQSFNEMPPPPPPDFDAPPPFDDGSDLPPPPPPRD